MSRHPLIEITAGELAATFYEAARSSGMKSKYPNARIYAKNNLETFVPKALELLLEMLGKEDTPEHMKNEIYDAIMERNEDKDLKVVELEKPKFKPHVEKPIIVNSIPIEQALKEKFHG